MSHLVYTLLVAILVAAAMAVEGDRSARDRCYAAIYWFASAMAFVFAGGWVMYWIHG